MSRITSGRITKKAGKKKVFTTLQLQGGTEKKKPQRESKISQGPPYSFP